jgi:hypothetical protein
VVDGPEGSALSGGHRPLVLARSSRLDATLAVLLTPPVALSSRIPDRGHPRRRRSSIARLRVCTQDTCEAHAEQDKNYRHEWSAGGKGERRRGGRWARRLSHLHSIRGGTSSALLPLDAARARCSSRSSPSDLSLVLFRVCFARILFSSGTAHRTARPGQQASCADGVQWSPPRWRLCGRSRGPAEAPRQETVGGSPGVKDGKGDDGRRHVTTCLHSQHGRRNLEPYSYPASARFTLPQASDLSHPPDLAGKCALSFLRLRICPCTCVGVRPRLVTLPSRFPA